MQTFITETLQTILTKQSSFENTVFVLPSQRAGVFVKQALKETIDVGFLPTILNIEQFIEEVSGLHKIDSIQLLFIKKQKKTQKSLKALFLGLLQLYKILMK